MEDDTQVQEETSRQQETETTSVIQRAAEAAERLELANKKQEELMNRQEALMAQNLLGGKSAAGSVADKPKELTEEEYATAAIGGQLNA